MAEGWDWTRVQAEPCPQCGYDPTALEPDEVGDRLRISAEAWNRLLVETATDALRRRPDADTWSALELGCHVRDVLPVFVTRVVQTVNTDEPEYGWWDHEAAVVEQGYNEQDPRAVAADLVANADELAVVLGAVPDGAWDRTGTRRGAEPFTVAGLARFVLHEAEHHHADAREALRR